MRIIGSHPHVLWERSKCSSPLSHFSSSPHSSSFTLNSDLSQNMDPEAYTRQTSRPCPLSGGLQATLFSRRVPRRMASGLFQSASSLKPVLCGIFLALLPPVQGCDIMCPTPKSPGQQLQLCWLCLTLVPPNVWQPWHMVQEFTRPPCHEAAFSSGSSGGDTLIKSCCSSSEELLRAS